MVLILLLLLPQCMDNNLLFLHLNPVPLLLLVLIPFNLLLNPHNFTNNPSPLLPHTTPTRTPTIMQPRRALTLSSSSSSNNLRPDLTGGSRGIRSSSSREGSERMFRKVSF